MGGWEESISMSQRHLSPPPVSSERQQGEASRSYGVPPSLLWCLKNDSAVKAPKHKALLLVSRHLLKIPTPSVILAVLLVYTLCDMNLNNLGTTSKRKVRQVNKN